MKRALRFALRTTVAVVALLALYVVVTFVQVWLASRGDHAQPAQAIVVFGAAQYDGRPSPVLQARLDHAYELWDHGYSNVVVLTGGRQAGDRFTEASAGARYLIRRGVPEEQLRLEVHGSNSWESLAAAARFLADEGITEVLLVSDPYHSYRITAIAEELGLDAHVSPADTSPSMGAQLRRLARETVAVSAGRIIGYRRLMRIDDAVTRRSR